MDFGVTTKTDLKEMVKKAEAAYQALSPAEKARHDHEQRRSHVRGMCPSRLNYNEWCEMVDRVIPPLASIE
jgi:hypothetical protein